MQPDRSAAAASPGAAPGGAQIKRASILFVNFFLIILAYYQIKPASRSLFIEYLGADALPYVWIGTALVLGTFIGYYHRLVARHSRFKVVLGTCLGCMALLVVFRLLLLTESAAAAIAFYIFVDIFSVVLVEQFWSLTNTIYSTVEGKRWYGFVGTGGLVGGVAGGGAAALVLHYTSLQTQDLLLVTAALIGVIVVLSLFMQHLGIYHETSRVTREHVSIEGWRAFLDNRYLLLIAAILLLAQMASPLVEYQFIKTVEAAYPADLDARTAFLSSFFSLLGLVAIGVNLGLTPLVHRYLGIFAGLLTQPLVLCVFSFGFLLQPILLVGAGVKISDRGLSYSINRASKELLYVPIDPVVTYQAKAWIDMFGYRLFKVLGSLIILLLTQWLPTLFPHFRLGPAPLSWVIVSCCVLWMLTIAYLAQEYRHLAPQT
jgi:AAA family ATP:ADP antiporter